MCARFITLRDIRSCPPAGIVALSFILAAPQEGTGADQDEAEHAGDDAVLHMHARCAGLMSREEAGQLIGGNQEIDGRNDKEDNAEQGQHELHEVSSMERRVAKRPCRQVYWSLFI